MRIPVLILAFVLSACAEKEAGQSTYIDQPYVANAAVQPALAAQAVEAEQVQAEILAGQQERRALDANAVTADERLVASLETAIETAGQPDVATGATMPSIIPDQPPAQTIAQTQVAATQQPSVEPVPLAGSNQISDNSFSSVTARETIESDAERLARLSASTEVLEAEPLPQQDGPNLAAFARSTTHRLGQRVYNRTGSRSSSAAARTCRKYGNPDAAQRAFLSQGGPQKDPQNIDPDGDGFVCGWSPDPFRSLRVN